MSSAALPFTATPSPGAGERYRHALARSWRALNATGAAADTSAGAFRALSVPSPPRSDARRRVSSAYTCCCEGPSSTTLLVVAVNPATVVTAGHADVGFSGWATREKRLKKWLM